MAEIPAYRLFNVTLQRKKWLTPSLMRCVFTGEQVNLMKMEGPDQRIKIFFPSLRGETSSLSVEGSWVEQLKKLPPEKRPVPRTYTLRHIDSEKCQLEVEFVIHGSNGPASAWVINALPGEHLQIVAPNRHHLADSGGYEWKPHAEVKRALIIADETALPAVKGILEQMAKKPSPPKMQVFLEVPVSEDRIDLDCFSFAEVHWLPRDRTKTQYGEALVNAVKDHACIPVHAMNAYMNDSFKDEQDAIWSGAEGKRSDFYGWIAAESTTVKQIRRYLVGERAVANETISFMAYWSLNRY